MPMYRKSISGVRPIRRGNFFNNSKLLLKFLMNYNCKLFCLQKCTNKLSQLSGMSYYHPNFEVKLNFMLLNHLDHVRDPVYIIFQYSIGKLIIKIVRNENIKTFITFISVLWQK